MMNSSAVENKQETTHASEDGATATSMSVHIRRSRLLVVMMILAIFAAALLNEIRGEEARIDGIELVKIETPKRSLRTPQAVGVSFQVTNQRMDVTADAQAPDFEITLPEAKDNPNEGLKASYRSILSVKDAAVWPIETHTSYTINSPETSSKPKVLPMKVATVPSRGKRAASNTINHSTDSTLNGSGQPQALKDSTVQEYLQNGNSSYNNSTVAEITFSRVSNVAPNRTAVLVEQMVDGTDLSIYDTAEALPDANMSDPDIASVYSHKALSQLNRLKTKIKRGESITLAVNGGSSSAGAPGIPFEDRYFVQLANRLESGLGANVTVIDRAHGARNTVHSAHLVPSFLPQNLDILLWEFAVNDGHGEVDVRNQMIMWLRNVEAHLNPPPLVLLVYLWKSPFQTHLEGKILCRTFDQHKHIGAEYDFVLGHFNMATYMDSLHWDFDTLKAAFLADRHHPNALVHHVIGKSLWQLLASVVSQQAKIAAKSSMATQKRTELEWICGTDTSEQRKVQQLFNVTRGIVRGSYTADLPRNPGNSSRPEMLVPSGPSSSLHMQHFGKSVTGRSDRQRGIVLPCCSNYAPNSSSIVEFDVSSLDRIQAIMLTLRCAAERRLDVRFSVDGTLMSNVTLIRTSDWKCLLGGYNMNIGDLPVLDVDLIFVSGRMKKIGFCDSRCDKNTTLPLVSVSAF
jgi:hypothetical protein